MQKPNFVVLSHNADNDGCGHYRMKFPIWALHTTRKDIRVIESTKYIPIPQFYQDMRLVRIQRHVSKAQCDYVINFLKPLSQKYGFWLAYEIDDVIGADDIPKYNIGRPAFQDPTFQDNVERLLQVCDIITVTTPELADYYVKKYNAPKENIYIVPNYLPKWWIGKREVKLTDIEQRFDSLVTRKPRIGFISSATHFDIRNQNGGVDDFSHIIDLIKTTTDKYEWVFVGGIPTQLKELHEQKKITYVKGFDFMNYPQMVQTLKFDIAVAPLQDNIFNRCKSNIKFLEMSAMGIPCICQNIITYNKFTDLLFDTADDLQTQINNLLCDKEKYCNTVMKNRDIIDNGDEHSPKGWWLENNLDAWSKLFAINQRPLSFDLNAITLNNEESTPNNESISLKL